MITITMKEENQTFLLSKLYYEWIEEVRHRRFPAMVNIDYLEQLLDAFKELSVDANSEIINYMQRDIDELKRAKKGEKTI